MNQAFIEHYRFPEELVKLQLLGELSKDSGCFRLGSIACFGRASHQVQRASVMGAGDDALAHVRIENGQCFLPFDPTELVENFRRERYFEQLRTQAEIWNRDALRSAYYLLRPALPPAWRRRLQRLALGQWQRIPFPRWPVDRSVEQIFESVLRLILTARWPEPLPFIWFWPHGYSACAILTHDVETRAGRDFCGKLMELDDAAGLKAAFEIVPERRYAVSGEFLDGIRRRGAEINVHDYNHDGKLFQSRNIFQRRLAHIGHYAAEFSAKGFRSGSLYRNLDWIAELTVEYDMSVPNVAHLEPQRGGCCTIMPYFVGPVLELPVTMAQDFGIFHSLRKYSTDLWMEQLDLVFKSHGLASFIVHPDYVIEERAQAVYRELLARLRSIKGEGRTWMELPSQVNDWWRQRAEMQLRKIEGKWVIEGSGSERARVAYARLVNGSVRYEMDYPIPVPEIGAQVPASATTRDQPPCSEVAAHSPSRGRAGMRNVLVIAYAKYISDGRIRKYAESLAMRGHRVDVLAVREKGQGSRAVIRGVHVYRIQSRERNEQSRVTYLAKVLLFLVNSFCWATALQIRRRYGLVHVHSVPDFEVFAALVPKAMGARIILDIHDILPEFYASKFGCSQKSLIYRILLWLEKLSAHFAHHVIASNDLWQARMQQRSVRPEKCSVVLNYPDETIFYRRPRRHNGGRLVFMYPGTLNHHQGLDLALMAFQRVRSRLPNSEFHIYGSGPDREMLEGMVRELGLSDRVRIMDSISLESVAEKMAHADVGVIPKRSNSFGDEAFSTKSLEFMALGVPVIISRTKIDDYYFDDSIVKFFTPGDFESLAECMYGLGSNAELRKILSSNAAEYVKRVSWQAKKGDYLRLVDGLISARKIRQQQ